MSLTIRLALHGCANRPFYHIVVMPTRFKRDDTPKEQLGTFDPLVNKHNEKLVAVNFDRLRYWLAQGARVSRPAAEILGLSGFLPIHPRTRLEASRRQKELAMKQTTEPTQPITENSEKTVGFSPSIVEAAPASMKPLNQ